VIDRTTRNSNGHAMDDRKQRAKKISLTCLGIALMTMSFVFGNLIDKSGYIVGTSIAAAAVAVNFVALLVNLWRPDA
jgi:hypothetical protein